MARPATTRAPLAITLAALTGLLLFGSPSPEEGQALSVKRTAQKSVEVQGEGCDVRVALTVTAPRGTRRLKVLEPTVGDYVWDATHPNRTVGVVDAIQLRGSEARIIV